jgi:hypothetical protein
MNKLKKKKTSEEDMVATGLHPDEVFISAGPTTRSSVVSIFRTNCIYRYSAKDAEIL